MDRGGSPEPDRGGGRGVHDRGARRTEVVNINRGDEFDVYVGREGKGQEGPFGNYVEEGQNRYERVAAYYAAFHERIREDPAFREAVESLRGKRLGCFCMPLLCHGTVIVEFLEGVTAEEQITSYVDSRIRKPRKSAPKKVERPLEPDMFEELLPCSSDSQAEN